MSQPQAFDPDAYLAKPHGAEFDPDSYLGIEPAPPHTSNVAVDAAKRIARETGAGGGQAVSGFGRLGEIVQGALLPGDLPPEIKRALLDSPAMPGTGKLLREAGAFVTGAAREAYDTDKTRDDTLVAKIAQGAGSLPVAIASGPAAPLTVASMMGEQGAEDARESLARRGITDPEEIRRAEQGAFLVNAPIGAASEALLGMPKLLKGVRLMEGASTASRIGRQVAVGAVREGAQEGLEQLAQNVGARDIVGYDPERSRTAGVGEAALLGSILGGPTGGAFQGAQEFDARAGHAQFKAELDTAKNIPESKKTLLLQQDQLLRGLRPAQMFPKGSPELPLPDGIERLETERGIFHFNPSQIDEAKLAKISEAGRENEVLALGPVSKPEAEARAAAGERPVAVTERAPDGTEIKTAVGTTATAAAQVAALEATKSPGSTVAVESPAQTITERLRAKQLAEEADARAALAREQLEREQRQEELAAKRLRFDETLAAADSLASDPRADFSKLKAALTSLDATIEDNSLGLTVDQRQAALARVSAIRPRAEAARAAFEAEQDARAAAAKAEEQARQANAKAARRAEREALDAIETTGRDPREGGAIVDITKIPDAEFEALQSNLDAEGLDLRTWEKEMERRIRVQESDAGAGVPRYSLLDLFTGANGAKDWASTRLTLPTPEALRSAGDPLAGDMEAIRESLPFSYFRKDTKGDLDGLAGRLRELGFRDATTPAAALDLIRRAAGGEDIRPTASADFATAAKKKSEPRRILTEDQVAKQFQTLRTALGPIAEQFDLQVGLVADLFAEEGYAREAESIRSGRLGDIAAATAPRLSDRVTALRAQRRFVVIAAEEAKKGNAPGLLLHELAHPFFDGLPRPVRNVLREMHAEETGKRTGPLYKDGKLDTRIAVEPSQFPPSRLKANPDLPVQEWFAERVRRLNESWLNGRTLEEKSVIRRLWSQLLEKLREVFARVRGFSPAGDLFTDTFREWLRTGNEANILPAATAYAARRSADFAASAPQEKPRADFATNSDEKPAPKAKPVLPPGVKTGADLEREQAAATARETVAAKSVRHPAAVGDVEPGMAWTSVNKLNPEQLSEQVRKIDAHLDEYALDLADIERANLQAIRAATEAEIARRKANEEKPVERTPTVPADVVGTPVPGIIKPDPETALIAQWRRGKTLRDDGRRAGNETAEDEGQALMTSAKARLDLRFPGWEEKVAPEPRARRDRSAVRPDQIEQDDGRNIPPPPPEVPAGRTPSAGDEPAPNRGRARRAFGHTASAPTWWAKSWDVARKAIVGIRGSIPELPTFPALAVQSDTFIREQGANFYDKLRAFYRTLNSSNDFIQRTAEEKVAAIVSPLLKLGGRFDAEAYAKLHARLQQERRFSVRNQAMPDGADAELSALEARLETHPYYLFNRLVFFMDLDWRRRNLKDSAGNPIRLPFNLNETEIESELAKLSAAIAASPHAKAIEDAYTRHTETVRSVADELKSRDLLATDELANPVYFPHLTLQMSKERNGKMILEDRELRPERVRVGTDEDFRGYLIEPVGSDKAIESDYVKAMYYHLVQVGAHNLKADAVRDYVLPYEKMAEVKKRAQELSRQRGVPVGWNQAFHEEYAPRGYVMMSHSKDNPYMALTIDRDKLARRLGVVLTGDDLQKQLGELGLKGVKLLPEDIKETLLMSGPEVWIVPARVAEALRGIENRSKKQDQPIEAMLRGLNGFWKGWKLFMPQNHVRYEYGNVVADLEKLFSASPRTFRFLGQSAKEMRAFFSGEAPADDLRAALRFGVINAITAQEMNQLQKRKAFEQFQTIGEKAKERLFRRFTNAASAPVGNALWTTGATVGRVFGSEAPLWLGLGSMNSVELSAFREGVTRYANFLANLDAIRNGARPDYAGAYWRDIEALGDSRPGANDKALRQAAQISRSTFGDYGDLSVSGQWMRDKLIPFYSWMEVNFKYHANLFRNLRDMVRADLPGGKGEAAAQAGRAITAAVGGRTSYLAGKVLLRLALPYVAVALWNATGAHGVDDDELSEEDRRRFHIRLGHDEDGKVRVLYGNTAFADVMKWFGGARFVDAFGDWLAGRTDFVTAVDAWAGSLPGDFVNNTVGSAGPMLKIPYVLASKKNPFPDVLDQRTIPAYDMNRAIWSQITDDFTADVIEQTVNKDYVAAKDLGTWAQQLILQVRRRDPESWAYYSIKDKAADFEEKMTGSRDGHSDRKSKDQQIVRNFRRAIYQGDPAEASRAYLRLLELGYTSEKFAQSVRNQEPLYGLKKDLRDDFVASLDETERQQLRRAYAFYTRVSVARGRERALFPSERAGERGAERFRERPRTAELDRIIETRDRYSDDEVLRRADLELRRSLAPSR